MAFDAPGPTTAVRTARSRAIRVARVVAVTCAAIAGSACTTMAAKQEALAQVGAAAVAWCDAFNARDARRVVALYEPEAMVWGTNATVLAATPVDVVAYFQTLGTRPDMRVVLGEQRIRIDGDWAIDSGDYTFSDFRDGHDLLTPARFTFVFHRHDGRWWIAAQHSSVLPAGR